MRIFTKKALREFWEKHPDCCDQLNTWYKITERATWKNMNQVKDIFPFVSLLKDNRAVFNIKGNSYRLVVKFNLTQQWVFVRFIGTHNEYDEIDANSI